MEFNLNRLNNSILGFALICVVIALTAGFFVGQDALSEDALQRGCYVLGNLVTASYADDLKRHDYAFLKAFVPGVLLPLANTGENPLGLCYIIIIDPKLEKERATAGSAEPVYEWINSVEISVRNDQSALPKHFAALRAEYGSVTTPRIGDSPYMLTATKRKVIDVLYPLGNQSTLAMGFLSESLNKPGGTLRGNFVLIGLAVMFVTSLGVLGLNSAVNRRVTRIVYEQQEKTRVKTKAEVLAEVKKAQAAEARKADDAPLDSNEFFGIIDLAKSVGSSLEVEQVLRQGVGSMVRVLGVQEVMVFMVDDNGEQLQATIGHDASGLIEPGAVSDVRVRVGQGEVGSVAEYGGVNIIDVPSPGTALVGALVSRGQVLGVFRCKTKVNGKPFGKRDKLIARQYSELVGNALYNAYLARHAGIGQAPAAPAPDAPTA